jgi:hypothetical protein
MVIQPVQVAPPLLLLALVLLVLALDDEDPLDDDPVDDDPVDEEPLDEEPLDDDDPVEDDPLEEEPVDDEPLELVVVVDPLDVVLDELTAEVVPEVEPCVLVEADRLPPPPPAAAEAPPDPQPIAAEPIAKTSTPIAAKGSRKAMPRLSAPNLGGARGDDARQNAATGCRREDS